MSRPIASEHREITELIRRIFDQLGGRASVEEIDAHLDTVMTDHLDSYLKRRGRRSMIGAVLRSQTPDGLPLAPDIGDGTHVQLELLSVEDFTWIIRHHVTAAKARTKRALAYQQRCLDQWGVLIDLDEIAGAA